MVDEGKVQGKTTLLGKGYYHFKKMASKLTNKLAGWGIYKDGLPCSVRVADTKEVRVNMENLWDGKQELGEVARRGRIVGAGLHPNRLASGKFDNPPHASGLTIESDAFESSWGLRLVIYTAVVMGCISRAGTTLCQVPDAANQRVGRWAGMKLCCSRLTLWEEPGSDWLHRQALGCWRWNTHDLMGGSGCATS